MARLKFSLSLENFKPGGRLKLFVFGPPSTTFSRVWVSELETFHKSSHQNGVENGRFHPNFTQNSGGGGTERRHFGCARVLAEAWAASVRHINKRGTLASHDAYFC